MEIERVNWTIGQVGKMINQACSAIRYWETEFPWIRAKKRRFTTKYRIYTRKEVEDIMIINRLLNNKDGMTISGVRIAHKMGYANELADFIDDKKREYAAKKYNICAESV